MIATKEKLWAVTCYYNPAGYRRRLQNYRAFRARLGAPLVAVELGYGQDFELEESDAEILIQLHCPDVMWQKERLLNIAIEAVPADVEEIAWLDCDILFESDDWVESASRKLDEFNLVHLFRRRVNLPPGSLLDAPTWDQGDEALSTISERVAGRMSDDALADSGAPVRLKQSLGLAWAAPRALLAEHGLYDAAIMGSADRLIANAALGLLGFGERAILMNEAQRAHYRSWAEPFHRSVAGQVGYVDQTVLHLWHGDLRNRKYLERHEGLACFDLDPRSDLLLDESGCWRWSSDKPELHDYVKDYFAARREDG